MVKPDVFCLGLDGLSVVSLQRNEFLTENPLDVTLDGVTVIVSVDEQQLYRGHLVLVPSELLDGKELGNVLFLMIGTLSELVFKRNPRKVLDVNLMFREILE